MEGTLMSENENGTEAGQNLLPGTAPLTALTKQLHERRGKARLGGGLEKIEKQHAAGKLTARERIDLLVDEGSFNEIGIHGRPHYSQPAMQSKEAPADGVVTGWGDVDGRPVAIVAYDFTVMAGSMGQTGEIKVTRIREMALQSGCLWSGCSTRPVPGSRKQRDRSSPVPATSSARRSRCPAWCRWLPR